VSDGCEERIPDSAGLTALSLLNLLALISADPFTICGRVATGGRVHLVLDVLYPEFTFLFAILKWI